MVRNRNVTPVLSAKYLFMVCVLCFLLFGCGFSGLFAQTSIKAELQLEKVDLPPAYKGGEQQFIEFLQKEIHYPADARAYEWKLWSRFILPLMSRERFRILRLR